LETACELCNGTGTTKDDNGHTDICPRCLGLGTVKVEESEEQKAEFAKRLKTRRPLVSATYILVIVMLLYYLIFILADFTYHFSLTVFIIILILGHSISVGGYILYVLWISFHGNGEKLSV